MPEHLYDEDEGGSEDGSFGLAWPFGTVRLEGLRAYLSDDAIETIAGWLHELNALPDATSLDPGLLDDRRSQLVAMKTQHPGAAIDRTIRVFMGELAVALDNLDDCGNPESPYLSLRFREHLLATGHAPDGPWRGALALAQVDNAIERWSATSDLAPEAALTELHQCLRAIRSDVTGASGGGYSMAGYRMLVAARMQCSAWLSDHEAVIADEKEYFRLVEQSRRESDAIVDEDELYAVTDALLLAHARRKDEKAVSEVVRKIRNLVEEPGGVTPLYLLELWERALETLDPAMAEMVARQMLMDAVEIHGANSDWAFRAAFALHQATCELGDFSNALELEKEWLPRALIADHGIGSQRWWEIADPGDA